MNKDVSIIICCAGSGTRLGISTPKALLHIGGKPLIVNLLDMLEDYDDIRVVVGYEADKLVEIINHQRKDIMFVFNHEYKQTGPAASFSKALIGARKYVVVLDGDTLIAKDDLYKLINYNGVCMTYTLLHSDEANYVLINNNEAVGFEQNIGNYEWLGAAKLETQKLIKRDDYIYEMIRPLLPLPAIEIDGRGIDTQDDYETAVSWFESQNR